MHGKGEKYTLNLTKLHDSPLIWPLCNKLGSFKSHQIRTKYHQRTDFICLPFRSIYYCNNGNSQNTSARARTRSVLLNLKRKAMCKNTAKFESEFINSLKENTSELKAAKKIELISSVELRKRISNQAILQ